MEHGRDTAKWAKPDCNRGFLEAAKRYARGGYDVVVDGIVGPWFLGPWPGIVQEGYEVHVIDTTNCSVQDTVSRIKEKSVNKTALLCR